MNKVGLLALVGGFLLIFDLSAALPGNWQVRNSPTNTHLRALAQGPSRIVAVGHGGTIISSLDGVNWTRSEHSLGTAGFFSVAYGAGVFVVGGRGNTLLATSPDASDHSWTFRLNANREEEIHGLTFADGWFVGVGNGSTGAEPLVSNIAISRDGFSWLFPQRVTPNTLRSVAHGNNRFVAVGDLGTLVTSADGLNWSVVNSGTMAGLNAVTYSGTRFIAAGDFGTVVISNDGLFWTVAAPTSFAVGGLASSSQAVLAVGSFGPAGRLHASSDGITWPGNSTDFAQALNGALRLGGGRFIVVGNNGLVLDSPGPTGGQVNSWTKTTSGNWEEPFWSLGPPSIEDLAVAFTNAGFKALAIGPNTAGDPNSLRIRNFTVDAPPGSGNLLLLNYAGLTVPLDVTGWFTIGTNGSLLSYYSAIEGDSLMLQGRATFAEFGRTRFTSVYLTNQAELVLSNGWFEALTEALQSVYETNNGFLTTKGSTWTQHGGTNKVASMTIESDSAYNLYGGTFRTVGGGITHIGTTVGPTEATLNIAGGFADMGEVVLGDLYDGPGFLDESRGQVLLYGGLFNTPRLNVKRGKVIQYGGTAQVGLMLLPGPDPAPAFSAAYGLQGGHLQSGSISLGQTQGGTFHQEGGSHTNVIGIVIHDRGLYEFFGGFSSAPRIEVRGGNFRQSSPTNYVATNYCPQLFITDGGGFEQFSGLLITFNMLVSQSLGSNYPSGYIQVGGEHRAGSIIIDSGGLYSLWRGTLSANSITVGAMGELQLSSNSVITVNGSFEMRGGGRLVLYSGTNELGSLRVSGNATIDFLNEGATIRFRDAGYTAGALDAPLDIINWTQGSDHLFVGSITDAQLSLITFVNPGGYPAGNCKARLTSAGEIVPLDRAEISFTRSANNMVLTWPEGYQLFSATNVDGPYEPVPNATSPYTASFADRQRFFIVRPLQ